ncbi:hypothetical protein BY458DRAFT_560249 [Sporodiniella umbellata]|nr:hypothetical protein BY458DRAFT_560249 [Sporodiniella umbellata]
MKLVAVLLSTVVFQSVLGDFLPELVSIAPTEAQVKPSLLPPEGHKLFDVFHAKGNRIYQCNPEKKGFQHWYSVQTHAFLYPTKNRQAPFDIPGQEIGQLSVAPINENQLQSNPIDVAPVIYYYPDGSWVSTGRPIKTTSMEMTPAERIKAQHLDDHLTNVAKSTTDGYLSHTKYMVRLNSMDGVAPKAEECTTKGMVINKPFSAYFMFYTDADGESKLAQEKIAWDQMAKEFVPNPKAFT